MHNWRDESSEDLYQLDMLRDCVDCECSCTKTSWKPSTKFDYLCCFCALITLVPLMLLGVTTADEWDYMEDELYYSLFLETNSLTVFGAEVTIIVRILLL